MKRPPPRPATALVLLACATFILLAPYCGLLGQLLTTFLTRMLGTVGTVLLVATLVLVATVVGAPGLLTSFLRDALRLAVAPQRGTTESIRPNKEQSPRARRALQDVRTALKNLGYLSHEIDPVVDAIDPTMPLEKAVKAALKQLNPTN